MKVYENAFDFPHSWKKVTLGVWQKYPNPMTSHVVSVDTISRTIDPLTGIIRTERLLGTRQALPGWVTSILGGSEEAYSREVSFMDPVNRITTAFSVNLTYGSVLSVHETIHYTPSLTKPKSQTLFSQTAEIRARGLWKQLAEKIETMSVERFRKNAAVGREGMECVLRRLWGDELVGKDEREVEGRN